MAWPPTVSQRVWPCRRRCVVRLACRVRSLPCNTKPRLMLLLVTIHHSVLRYKNPAASPCWSQYTAVYCDTKPQPSSHLSHNTRGVLRHTYPLAKTALLSQYNGCIVTHSQPGPTALQNLCVTIQFPIIL